MDINEIIPYARNARHNKKAIPAVADSIRQFGLRGQIVLESRENPVIVTGHTRVEVCKSLGWKEIPDENIAYCDGLTEDEIKAYRIADNKTGEISTWNISMLKSEVKSIGKLDMSKFGCDFKSKNLAYGAERLKTDKGYSLDIINRYGCGASGMPELPAIDCEQKLCNGKTRERLTESKENVEEKLILSSAVATLRGDRKQEELLISWTLAIEIWLITILKNSQRLLTLA